MAAPSPPAAPVAPLVCLAFLVLAAYGTFLWTQAQVQPGGSYSSGYFHTARLLAEGRIHAPMRWVEDLPPENLPFSAYAPLGFQPDPATARLTPTYPIGLSLFFLGFVGMFLPDFGPTLVLLLHALAGVWLVDRLARTAGAGPAASLLAAGMVALSPLTLLFSLQAMSDVPAMFWVTAAVWLAWRAPSPGLSALAAGFALGVAVLLRPTNALAVAPVLPALAVATVLTLQHLLAYWPPPRHSTAAGTALALLTLGSHGFWLRRWHLPNLVRSERCYPDAIRLVRQHVPAGAVIRTFPFSGALFSATDHPLLRWNQLDDAWLRIRAGLQASRRPVYGLFFAHELPPALQERVPEPGKLRSEALPVSLWQLVEPAADPPPR